MENENIKTDVLLVGAGIMSLTLAALLRSVQPDLNITIIERLGAEGFESSDSYSNAGTGHSGYCELNYDLQKATKTCLSFEESKEFWAYLAHKGLISNKFINKVPHISFVQGKEDVEFLRERYKIFKQCFLFRGMEFSEDPNVISEWVPLVMKSRDSNIPVAATRMERGTDVDFGMLTRELKKYLESIRVKFMFFREATGFSKKENIWHVNVHNRFTTKDSVIEAGFVFIGAGGAALTLLEKTGISEAQKYGGFPVSGKFLICHPDKSDIAKFHNAKVYGRPKAGSPPMSAPHLDKRIIDGHEYLMFGPYAGVTTSFLKLGHWTDFFKSLRFGNLSTIIESGVRNLSLVKYLFTEVLKTKSGRFKELQKFYPDANPSDWELIEAGKRVQVIKRENGKAIIEFGTEVVVLDDGSIAALLGASPGGSTSVHIMAEIIEKCFSSHPEFKRWQQEMSDLIPVRNASARDVEFIVRNTEMIINTNLDL